MKKSIIVFLIFFSTMFLTTTSKVYAAPSFQRIAGHDRYETAIQLAQTGWPEKSNYVILATGEDYPDALCSVPLAKKYNCPILLNIQNKLLPNVKSEIVRLGAEHVIIVGGPGVISSEVETELKNMNIETTRIFGEDRYETAIKIAEQLNKPREIAVVTGSNFPDAISISSIAAQKGMPILLTGFNYLPQEVEKYLQNENILTTYIVGSNDVVSDEVASKLPNVIRLAGSDRYDTNIEVLKKFANDLNYSSVYLATGEDYPDALAASALAARTNSPLCLVDNNSSSFGSLEKLGNTFAWKLTDNTMVIAVGEEDVVSDTASQVLLTYHFDNSSYPANQFVASDGQYDFYVNGNNGLYRVPEGGTDSSLLDEDANKGSMINIKSDINVEGDWIYYDNREIDCEGELTFTKSAGIYKIKSDGTGKTKIVSDDAQEMKVVGNTIYYINNSDKGKPYEINLDGTGKTKLSDDEYCYNLNISGDSAYYLKLVDPLSPRQLYKVKLDGSGRVQLATDKWIKFMKVSGNFIYFITDSFNSSRIYRMNTDGGGEVMLLQSPNLISSLADSDGNVYYFDAPNPNSSNGAILYKITSAGQSMPISDQLFVPIGPNVVNNKLYCYGNASICRINLDGSNLQIIPNR